MYGMHTVCFPCELISATVSCSRHVPLQISHVVKIWGKIRRFQLLCADVSLFHGRQNSSFNDGKQSFEDGRQSFMTS